MGKARCATLPMMIQPIDSADIAALGPNGRIARRRSLFVAATLHSDDEEMAVRIRNLSEFGVLLEGLALPPVGAAVVLRRGALRADGVVAWREPSRCGLTVTAPLSLDEWLGRAGSSSLQRPAPISQFVTSPAIEASLHADAEALLRLLDELGTVLRADISPIQNARPLALVAEIKRRLAQSR